ncbi:MAG: hypothetical protein E7C52_04900 [Streptococcus lutetiensis]|nr:hypothetical protein [Streptococcus lutetiensis]MDU2622210.1 hypothetical protein [Streptococcus lutetiensis]MDU2675773.1 hypothetical protein [Streptococcus lutetiensis]
MTNKEHLSPLSVREASKYL